MGCCKENGDNESKVPGPRATTGVKQARHLGDKMQGETHSPAWILHLSTCEETQLLRFAPYPHTPHTPHMPHPNPGPAWLTVSLQLTLPAIALSFKTFGATPRR